MDVGGLLRYWSLTVAVFIFYIFAILVASMDVFEELRESAHKRRAQRRPSALDPNPLADRSVAATILPGPGQRLDARRRWVAGMAGEIVARLGLGRKVQTLVLEDSKGHALVHFTSGSRLETYRVDRAIVDAAVVGDASKAAAIAGLLERHLAADFLGREDARPPRTTELAREAGARPAPGGAPTARAGVLAPGGGPAQGAVAPRGVAAAQGAVAPQGVAAPQGAVSPEGTIPAKAVPVAGPPAQADPGAPAEDPERMSREERLAAARARAEALRAARQAGKPPESK